MDMEFANSSNYIDNYDSDNIIQATPYTTEIVVNSVLLYIGVCTNIWMIRSLYKSWKTGSRMHFYLLAICVADLLGLCIGSGVNIGLLATVVWKAGYYGCKVFSGIQLFGATMSHLILAGFNIDNLFTITCSRSIKALRIVFLLLSFITASIMSGVKFQFLQLRVMGHREDAYYCGFVSAFDYALLPFIEMVVYFLLPLLMMLLFGLPSLFVWCCKKGTLSYEKMTSDDDPSTDIQFIGRDIGIVLAYDVVFFLCIAPFYVTFWFFRYSVTLFTVFAYLWIANPCLNPFIYAIFNYIGRRRERTSPGL